MALYDTIGDKYAQFRRPDPRIATAIEAALGDAMSVVNIGAGRSKTAISWRSMLWIWATELFVAKSGHLRTKSKYSERNCRSS